MKTRYMAFFFTIALISSFAQAEKSDVVSACAQDIKAAGCDGKKVGEGLLKCLKEHKKENKGVKLSKECKESIKAEKEARVEKNKNKTDEISTACADEIKTTGCADKKIGNGLLKCLHGYKKGNKEFKFSPTCKQAMKAAK